MNKQDLDAIRRQLKDKGISGAQIARHIGRSPAWVNSCLAGHYPYSYAYESGAAIFPRNLEDALLTTFHISIGEV